MMTDGMKLTAVMLLIAVGLVTAGASQSKNDNRSQRPPLTNEDLIKERPEIAKPAISADEDPVDVVARAREALLKDTSHRCWQEGTNNSGPGSLTVMVVEVAGPDRVHASAEERGSQPGKNEFIVVGDNAFRRTDKSSWERVAEARNLYRQLLLSIQMVPYKYQKSDLKLVNRDVLAGAPVFLYESNFQAPDFKKTIRTWVGVNDNLPHKMEELNVTTGVMRGPIIYHVTTYCTFDTNIKIEPPIK